MAKNWIDISVTVREGMVRWPDNPDIKIERVMHLDRGDVCTVSNLSLGAHTGTHMDGLSHFIRAGRGLDKMPIEAVIGPARVIEIRDRVAVQPSELLPHRLKRGERILFKTRNSKRSWKTSEFDEDFVFISKDAAQLLVDKGVQTVGIDYLSVGGYKQDGVETHRILLGAGIWVIEGLNLAKVTPGPYDLICLPMKIQDSDGAPARAVLRPR